MTHRVRIAPQRAERRAAARPRSAAAARSALVVVVGARAWRPSARVSSSTRARAWRYPRQRPPRGRLELELARLRSRRVRVVFVAPGARPR